MEEDKYYQSGNRRMIVEWKGIRFILLTCYDLRFPSWARYKGDYDAIIIVANWPESETECLANINESKNHENQCFWLVAIVSASDDYCHYIGRSAIIDPKGYTIVESSVQAKKLLPPVLILRN